MCDRGGTVIAKTSNSMFTISVFLLTTGSVLTSVWWACKNEDASPVTPRSEVAEV
jgi:hypothetical protein